MSRRLAVAVCVALALSGCGRPRVDRVEWTVMGTVAAVQSRGACDPRAVECVRQTFSRVESLLNAHSRTSELSRLAALPDDRMLAECDPETRPCYEAAFRLARETGGSFNPRWRGPGTFDLGAIAKGFAADLAERELKRRGLCGEGLLIDIGGNLKAVSGEWKTGVYDPAAKGADGAAFVLRPGEACATSAEYARGRHIYDGRTGRPVESDAVSVTVVHPASAMLADGLSTVVFIFGREKGDAFLRGRYPEARAIWRFGR